MSVWQMQTEARLNNLEGTFETVLKRRLSKLEARLLSLQRQFSIETKTNKRPSSRRSNSNTTSAESLNDEGLRTNNRNMRKSRFDDSYMYLQ
mmetsp:Transcript_4904/g.6081  ORF Transcript_4904/g.6081 Transcript_4904/m.6081 type:complete len:92 (+) Transcript_4904:164-439(+)